MPEQIEKQVAHRTIGRLSARHEHEAHERANLIVGQPLTVDLRVAHHGQQVVGARRGSSPCRDDGHDVLRQLRAGLQTLADRLLLTGEIGDEVHHRLIPAREVGVVLLREGQHLLDHGHRIRVDESLDEVDLMALSLSPPYRFQIAVQPRVSELVSDLLDLGDEALESSANEERGEQSAVRRVLLALQVDDRLAVDGLDLGRVVLGGHVVRIAQQPENVSVPADEPCARRFLVVDRMVLEQHAVRREWIRVVLRREPVWWCERLGCHIPSYSLRPRQPSEPPSTM